MDDKCQVVGSFRADTTQHAYTTWMAWLHYRYRLDKTILREVAWPLLNGRSHLASIWLFMSIDA